MINQIAERTIARILGIGSAFVAIVVVTGAVTDPVNVSKLFALGGVAVSSFVVALGYGAKLLWNSSRAMVSLAVLFLIASVNAILNSSGPLTQNIYGVYGRNTGFLTYILLIFMALSAIVLRAKKSFTTLIFGLFTAGIVNVIYCGWVILFGDFVPWNNPYGNILGTFGNPNFIGAFLGFFAACLVAYSLKSGLHPGIKILSLVIFIVSVLEIIDSSAIQGRVVVAAGLAIVGFYFLRSRTKSAASLVGYIAFIAVGGIYALFGALQIGPLAKYIYKTSVSLRGEYWQAGWNMAADFPFTGVGFDTYGDWYRRARDTQALILPGPNITTNAAHNVPFDVLSFGGWTLFIPYLGILLLSVIAIIKVTIRSREYDPIFVTLTTAWVCYQLQSVISINQIGLAIWGWLFGGALIAYEITTRKKGTDDQSSPDLKPNARKAKVRKSENVFSSTLIAGIGAVFGLLLAVPPYSADATWRSAISSQDARKVEAALTPGYLNPENSYKYANAAQLFEGSKLYDLAYKYAKIGVEFNRDNFDAWRVLHFVSKSTPEDKAEALAQMKRLDPNNPNVLG